MKKHIGSVVYGAALFFFTLFITLDTFVLSTSYQNNATGMNTDMFESVDSSNSDKAVSESSVSGAATRDSDSSFRRKPDSASGRGPGHRSGQNQEGFRGDSFGGKKSEGRENSQDSGDSQGSSESTQKQSSLSNGSSSEIGSSQDDNVTIRITEYYQENTKIYVADVTVKSAQYIKTAFANDTYGKNVTAKTSEIAKAHSAKLAINGDYYGTQERGYVIRNGIVYREAAGDNEVLCLYADGSFQVIDPAASTAKQLVEQGVWQAFSFGPGLVKDGAVAVSEGEEVGKAMASNPRTAVGMIEKNHYVFIVSDGRTSESEGLSLYQLAQFMKNLGVQTGYNLDGGGSSSMYFDGKVINNPTTNGGRIQERGVSDIVYVG